MCNIDNEIRPFFNENNIPIIFQVSKEYIPYLDVAISSIINFSSISYNYDIIVMLNEIDDNEKNLILRNKKNNISIRFFNPSKYVESYINSSRYNYLYLNYWRLSLPWILRGYDKVINLGVDIVVLNDIANLFVKYKCQDYTIAAARDLGYIGRLSIDISKKELELKYPLNYFNSDVLLINLDKIRNAFSQDTIMSFWQKKYMRCAEQDVFNIFFNQSLSLFDLKWNLFPKGMNSEQHIACAPDWLKDEWESALKTPCLIHFAACPKPWVYPMIGFGDIWWSYARKSVFYEEIIRKMCISSINQIYDKNKSFYRTIFDVFFPKGSHRREILKRILKRKRS